MVAQSDLRSTSEIEFSDLLQIAMQTFGEEDPLEEWYTTQRPNREVTTQEFRNFCAKVGTAELLPGLSHGEYPKLIIETHGFANSHLIAGLTYERLLTFGVQAAHAETLCKYFAGPRVEAPPPQATSLQSHGAIFNRRLIDL